MIAKAKGRGPIREAVPASLRVAVYCRQSVEDSTSDFGSLDAQREAVEAYVESQRGEGWSALAERYDDGGFTGANTDRPAFQRLLGDIEAGRVDAVAVYKIDRLSRSLLDFTQLMEQFRRKGVTFVSVTQQFSTSTPVGRMTLNLLATFAEFERETIAERTRDKMAAARRRGMWTGGRPALGYDVVERKLIVNHEEAARVMEIFRLFAELGSVMAVIEVLRERGWTSKSWLNKRDVHVQGKPFEKDALRRFLSNPLYVGKVTCGGESYAGAHVAIVDQTTFDAVQVLLRTNPDKGRRPQPTNKWGVLLAGLVRCGQCGAAMTHHYTMRKNRRYSYYICQTAAKQGATACRGSRVPTGAIEEFVVDKIRSIGGDPRLLAETIAAAKRDLQARKPELVAELRNLEQESKRLASERTNLVNAVARGLPAFGERIGEVDRLALDVARRAQEVRTELLALEGQVLDEQELREALAAFDPVWGELFPKERTRVLRLLIEGVVFDGRTSEVAITFRPCGIRSLGRSA